MASIILIVGVCARAPLAPTRCWQPAEGLMSFSASVCMVPCRDRPCLCLSPVLLRSDVAERCENLTLRCFEEVPWGSRSGSSMGPARCALRGSAVTSRLGHWLHYFSFEALRCPVRRASCCWAACSVRGGDEEPFLRSKK